MFGGTTINIGNHYVKSYPCHNETSISLFSYRTLQNCCIFHSENFYISLPANHLVFKVNVYGHPNVKIMAEFDSR